MVKALKPFSVSVPKSVIRRFIKRSKEQFPKEMWGAFIGTDSGNGTRQITVHDIYVPENVGRFSRGGRYPHVVMRNEWFVEADEYAKECGLSFLGDIHSHPYTYDIVKTSGRIDKVPSEGDLDETKWDGLSGIVTIEEYRPFKLRAGYRIWGPFRPVSVTEY